MIFSLAWNIIFSDNWKVLVLKFLEMKNMVFLSQKVDENMIFTGYRKVLVLIFLEIGNTVFSWAKTLIERWYLLITEKVLFWTFRWWKIRSFFESISWWKDDIYWLRRNYCFELFGDGKYGFSYSQKFDGKMIFTWFFWAFYDIPRPGKYGFLRSVVSLGGCTCDAFAPHFYQNLFWCFIWYLWIHFTQCSNISFTGFQDANTSWAIFLLCLISRYVEANLRRSNKHRRYNLPLPELFCIIYLIHLQNVMSQKLN